jgi:hypothetical protein
MAAQHALLAAAQAISSELAHFSGWLMTGAGASFALLIANLSTVLAHVYTRSFKWSLAWFALSLLAGLYSRWLAASVAGVTAAIGVVQSRAERVGPTMRFNILAFTKFMVDASLPIYKCFAWRGYRRSKAGDFISSVRPLVRKSQWQSLLTLAQVALIFISVLVLAHGVKT